MLRARAAIEAVFYRGRTNVEPGIEISQRGAYSFLYYGMVKRHI